MYLSFDLSDGAIIWNEFWITSGTTSERVVRPSGKLSIWSTILNISLNIRTTKLEKYLYYKNRLQRELIFLCSTVEKVCSISENAFDYFK
jgi:hypothetical protein